MKEKIKILYIAGWGRSGSTLLDNILGQLDGFFSGGELRYIWERGFLENRKCGCGQPFRECHVWGNIVKEALQDFNHISPDTINKMTFQYTRTIRTLWLLARKGENLRTSKFIEYLKIIESLYIAISHQTKCRIIVDSSKYPAYGGVLRLIPSFDVYIIHLIRDPRAVAYSWMTPKLLSDFSTPVYFPKINPIASGIWWNGWNLATEKIGGLMPDRYIRLKYEEFVSNPRVSIKKILALIGDKKVILPIENERTVILGQNHTISGNPIRFMQGGVEIKPDMRWLSEMDYRHKSLVTLFTLPFLNHFGYSINYNGKGI